MVEKVQPTGVLPGEGLTVGVLALQGGVALAVDFAGLNDVGAVCEDVPVLDVRGVLFVGARDGLGGFC